MNAIGLWVQLYLWKGGSVREGIHGMSECVWTPAGSLSLAAEAQEVSFSIPDLVNKHSLTQNTQSGASHTALLVCSFPRVGLDRTTALSPNISLENSVFDCDSGRNPEDITAVDE